MRLFSLLALLILTLACNEDRIPIPKPRIYPKVIYPARNYVPFDQNYCSFSFEHPDYMEFEQDTLLVNQDTKHACWFTLNMPSLNGNIHFTYTDISGDSARYKLLDVLEDSYTMSEKHNLKATGKEIFPFMEAEKSLYGITFAVGGDVASPYHFILTDSVHHAVWASLYFNARPHADSMAPIVNYVKEDLEKLIASFKWNE